MVIYKYVLAITDTQFVKVGDRKAKPLSVAEQNGNLCLWVQVDEDYAGGECEIQVDIVGTGNHFEWRGDFVGTVPMSNGLVWHVYCT